MTVTNLIGRAYRLNVPCATCDGHTTSRWRVDYNHYPGLRAISAELDAVTQLCDYRHGDANSIVICVYPSDVNIPSSILRVFSSAFCCNPLSVAASVIFCAPSW
jgi:hypothetical protein